MPTPSRRWAYAALAGVGATSVLAVWWLYSALVATLAGQRRELRLTERVTAWATGLPTGILEALSALTLLLALVVAVGIALVRRRPDLAVVAVALTVGANITTQVLKVLLHRPDLGLGGLNSFPSGHTTVAATMAAALVVVLPGRLRPVAALAGLAFTAWAGLSTVVDHWHRVTDVFAAPFVVLAWTAVALLVVRQGPTDAVADDDRAEPQLGLTRR